LYISAVNLVSSKKINKYQNKPNNSTSILSPKVNFEGSVDLSKVGEVFREIGRNIKKTTLWTLGKKRELLKTFEHEEELQECLEIAYNLQKETKKSSLGRKLFSKKMIKIIERFSNAVNKGTDYTLLTGTKKEYYYTPFIDKTGFSIDRVHVFAAMD